MAVGKTFDQVVHAVKLEAGWSTHASTGRNMQEQIEHVLRRVYERTHEDFPWPHLLFERDIDLQAGQRHYSFPSDMDPNRVTGAWALEDEQHVWREVDYGITPAHWNTYSPERDERADPVRAWERHNTGEGAVMVEVWPVPRTSTGVLRIQGMPYAKRLVSESDIVDLDDQMLALQAAGELLARQGSADAEMKLQQAERRYQQLRSNQHGSNPQFSMNPKRRRTPAGVQVRAPRT